MMLEGYIKLHRQSIKSRVFKNPDLWKVWTWCLMKANHAEKWVPVKTGRGETEIKVEPGQFIYGRKKAAQELNMPESSIKNRMAKLKNMQNLTIKPDTHFSIITIINWNTYQDIIIKVDRQVDNQRTTKGQPKDTNKNDKNEKNVKKEIYGEFKNVLLSEEEIKKLKESYGEDTTLKRIETLSSYMESKGKKYKSHYATILNWLRKDGINGKQGNDEGHATVFGKRLAEESNG